MWGQIAGAVGGGLMTGLLQNNAQRETNAANAGMAREQMDFQERMSGTAHQREVQDLIAAGLNPKLSAGGNGSSTPSGAMGTASAPQLPHIDFPGIIMQSKALDQADQRLALDKANSAAGIAKTMSETELTKMKKILSQKGMIRADLEGNASEVIKKGMQWLKKQMTQPDPLRNNFQTPSMRQQNLNPVNPNLP